MKKSILSCILVVSLGFMPVFGYEPSAWQGGNSNSSNNNYGGYEDDGNYGGGYDDYGDYGSYGSCDSYGSGDCSGMSDEEMLQVLESEFIAFLEQIGMSEEDLNNLSDEEFDQFLEMFFSEDFSSSLANDDSYGYEDDYGYDDYGYDDQYGDYEDDYGQLSEEDFMEFLDDQNIDYSDDDLANYGDYYGDYDDYDDYEDDSSNYTPVSSSEIGDAVYSYAKQYTERFVNYSTGGQDFLRNVSVDCSGLVINCYKHALSGTNYSLPFSDTTAYNMYARYSTPTDNPEMGDLVFMCYNGSGTVDHIGIFEGVSNGKVYFIDSTPNYYNNSGSAVNRRSYPINDHRIVGYGIMNLVEN